MFRVEISHLLQALNYRASVNAVPLDKIEWTMHGKPVSWQFNNLAYSSDMEEWRFTSLSNVDFALDYLDSEDAQPVPLPEDTEFAQLYKVYPRLMDVYSCARAVLRYNGVDEKRCAEMVHNLDDAIEAVKDPDAVESAYREKLIRLLTKLGLPSDLADMPVEDMLKGLTCDSCQEQNKVQGSVCCHPTCQQKQLTFPPSLLS